MSVAPGSTTCAACCRRGGFSEEEQDWLVNCLQSGSLTLRPVLEQVQKVDATLGSQAVSRGAWATTVTSTLATVRPSRCNRATTSRSRIRLSMFSSSALLSGK